MPTSRRHRPLRAGWRPPSTPDGDLIPHSGVARTLRDLVHPWTADGDATTAAVHGDVRGAIGALDGPEVRLIEVSLSDALAWLGWAGASGGAHGRRRGAAAGRLDAWMVLAELVDLGAVWPLDPEELGQRSARLRWYVWDAVGIGPTGWVLRARGRGSRPRRRVRLDGPRPRLTASNGAVGATELIRC